MWKNGKKWEKSCLGQDFNFKLGCFGYECNCMPYKSTPMPRVENLATVLSCYLKFVHAKNVLTKVPVAEEERIFFAAKKYEIHFEK